MKVKYKGKYSNLFSLPGGGPQGTLLGLFPFLVLINDAGYNGQENNIGELITSKKKIKEMNVIHLKYVDDLTLAESIDMASQLSPVSLVDRPQPDTFRARTGHKLNIQTSKVYKELKEIQAYAEQNKMKLNIPKTKLMLFNPCRTKNFMPELVIEKTRVDLVERTNLLGVIQSSNLSWEDNRDFVQRCTSKIWILRKLKKLGASPDYLMESF